MVDVQTTVASGGSDNYPHLMLAFLVFAKYTWIGLVLVGIPGNIITGFAAIHAQNQQVSMYVYMLGMATCDTCVLLQLVWQFPLTYFDHGMELLLSREYIYK
jgi:hypothetical protein